MSTPRRKKVKLDFGGMAQLAKGVEMHKLVHEVAEKLAGHVRGEGIRVGDHDGGKHEIELPVTISVTTTDRAVASVILAHPAGTAVQAKHGVLTRAAAAEGLVVKSGGSDRRLVRYTSAAGKVSTITLAQALNYGGSYEEL